MRLLKYIVFLLAFIYATSSKAQIDWIAFEWVDDYVNGKKYEKVAMNVPVSIENLPYNFYAQFDLGARNVLDQNCIAPFIKQYKSLASKYDSATVDKWHGVDCSSFNNLEILLDKTPFNTSFLNMHNQGETIDLVEIDTLTPIRIGTIGVDMFYDKILIIDYPNQRLAVLDSVPEEYHVQYEKCKFEHNRIKIPVTVKGKQEFVLFDTGSSMFEMITTKQNWSLLADTSPDAIDSLSVNSWGKQNYVYWSQSMGAIDFNAVPINNINIYYGGPQGLEAFLKKEELFGITGNKVFWNNIVVIDLKSEQFGIVSYSQEESILFSEDLD